MPREYFLIVNSLLQWRMLVSHYLIIHWTNYVFPLDIALIVDTAAYCTVLDPPGQWPFSFMEKGPYIVGPRFLLGLRLTHFSSINRSSTVQSHLFSPSSFLGDGSFVFIIICKIVLDLWINARFWLIYLQFDSYKLSRIAQMLRQSSINTELYKAACPINTNLFHLLDQEFLAVGCSTIDISLLDN